MSDHSEESLGILLADATRLFWRRLEAALAAAGLDYTAGEARVMITLDDMTGTRQGPLAERLHVEPMTLVGHLDRLEARGLVARRPDPCDRRAKLVEPTALGRTTTAAIRTVSAAVRASLVVGLEDDEVSLLRRLLQRVRHNLAGDAGKAVRP